MTVPPPAELTPLTAPQTTTSPYRYERPETTSSGKARFEVLDGLRGSAAFLILLFHIQGITVLFEGPRVLLHHAPLAVDFFFALSGGTSRSGHGCAGESSRRYSRCQSSSRVRRYA